MGMLKILVNGALGKMGSEVVKAVNSAEDLQLVAVVDPKLDGVPQPEDVLAGTDLAAVIAQTSPDVVVDFTRPDIVMENLRTILRSGAHAVVGTTGFSAENLQELRSLAEKYHTSLLIAPNFALGAILMMKMAAMAAKYFPQVEIIELHHEQKLDAPSGTACLTAQKLAEIRGGYVAQGHPEEKEILPHARGAEYEGIRIHSVRLPGFVASEEIIFGSQGETLKIRNDSINRECYMPGVLLGCRKIVEKTGLVYGLDSIME